MGKSLYAAEIIDQYLARDEAAGKDLATTTEREGDGTIRFTSVRLIDHMNQSTDSVFGGQDMAIELTYEGKAIEDSSAIVFHLYIRNNYGERLFTCSTRYTAQTPTAFPGTGTLRCTIPRLPLAPGQYSLDIATKYREKMADHVWGALTINVGEGDYWGSGKVPRPAAGPLMVDHRFEVVS